MDLFLDDTGILALIENGENSDIEGADKDNAENEELREYLTPREPLVLEEIVQDDDFEEQLAQLTTADDIIEAVVRGEIGIELIGARKPAIFDVLTDSEDIEWKKQIFTTRYPPDWEEPLLDTDIVDTPLNYFFKYIPVTLFESAAFHTKMYAIQQNNIRFKQCIPEEIETLFGLHIAIGTLRLSRVRMAWNQDIGFNLFLDNMTRDRFFNLRSHLHFVNNLERPPTCKDKFFKVRPIFDAVRNQCLQLTLTRELSIDEQMIPFTGNMSAKQFVRGKPNPWGIKNFVVCSKDGIAYDFLLYHGKSTKVDPEMKDLGVSAAVVLKLCEHIEKKGHVLYFDNYFNSYNLLQVLKSK